MITGGFKLTWSVDRGWEFWQEAKCTTSAEALQIVGLLTTVAEFLGRQEEAASDSDGTATAAVCEDIPVPEGLPSAAIAQTKSVNP